ncbi:winged helix-turn-helix domain-containing protein [Teichococcus vastitatis]|jgi:two-component system cell cycle response regulator CtrA|uniref:Response regulator transcription factor n=1 Tax=Teichococcus vastitatis TaxID=2307076 RepID=A0ABS9VZX0_9PROT|nr:response regulator transcription factor [Pseudoroseomonas vastitatis]MCI0752596.1 response regulator transcription factor [Pseudoroseomonas vastitatis]
MHILLGSHLGSASVYRRALQQIGHSCDLAEALEDTPSAAQHSDHHDVILLEIGQLDRQGLPLIRDTRRRGVQSPLMISAARLTAAEEQAALECGADQVLQGPPHPPLLNARLQAVLRRSLGHSGPELRCGNVVLHQARGTVVVDDRPVGVTASEFAVLEMLMLRPGVMLTKEHFMARAYGEEDGPDYRILDVFICKLRRKLAAAGSAKIVRTIWGRGYAIEEPSASDVAAARARLTGARLTGALPRSRRTPPAQPQLETIATAA